MKVVLTHRHHGAHEFIEETTVPGVFADYAEHKGGSGPNDYLIDENKLVDALPDGFLPVPTALTLLVVEDELGGTGQLGLKVFRDWAKYFDAYCLNIVKDEADDSAESNHTPMGVRSPEGAEVVRDASQLGSAVVEAAKRAWEIVKPAVLEVARIADTNRAGSKAFDVLIGAESMDEMDDLTVFQAREKLSALDPAQLKEIEQAAMTLARTASELAREKRSE